MYVKMYFVLLIYLFMSVKGQHDYITTTAVPIDLYIEVCLNESGARPSDVDSLKNSFVGIYNKSSIELKKWVFCYLKKTGVMSSSGVLRQHVVLKNIPKQDRNTVERTINKCLYNKAHDPVDTAWHYLTCFRSELPQFAKDANHI